MRRQRQEPLTRNNRSINHQVTDYTLFLLPGCSKVGAHFATLRATTPSQLWPGSPGGIRIIDLSMGWAGRCCCAWLPEPMPWWRTSQAAYCPS